MMVAAVEGDAAVAAAGGVGIFNTGGPSLTSSYGYVFDGMIFAQLASRLDRLSMLSLVTIFSIVTQLPRLAWARRPMPALIGCA
jgi:hypothetical protein